MRSSYRIPVHRPAVRDAEPYINLSKAAKTVGVTPKTRRLAAEAGEIEAIHPLPDGPWIFSRQVLAGLAAQMLASRAGTRSTTATGQHLDQQNLFGSTT